MLIHKERLTGTASSGSLTLTSVKFSGVRATQIFCNPATATTTYNIAITDGDSDQIFQDLDVEGQLLRESRIPLRGVYTISITGASTDELFTFFFGTEEDK